MAVITYWNKININFFFQRPACIKLNFDYGRLMSLNTNFAKSFSCHQFCFRYDNLFLSPNLVGVPQICGFGEVGQSLALMW